MLSECMVCNVAIIIVTFFSAVYLYFKYAYTYWKRQGIPYLEPEFPYGNAKLTIKKVKAMGEAIAIQYNFMKAKGYKFCGTYFFQNPVFVAVCPDLIKNILQRDFSYFVDRGVYHDEENDPLSAHLFSLNGQKWKNLRAKLSPTFTSGKMKKMFPTLVECSHNLKDCLKDSTAKDEAIDIKRILVQYTTDVIGSCAFGIECNSFKDPNTEFLRLSQKMFSPSGIDRMKLFFAFTFPSIAKKMKMRITNKEVDTFYRKVVKDTIEYRETNNVTRNDFMQLLIQLKNNGIVDDDDHNEHTKKPKEVGSTLTLNEASAQAFIFFVAGFETSSTTMQFCMFELSQNQEIQNKLRHEIIRVLKRHEGKITYDALAEMHYMDRVVQETLRIYPPVMVLQRIATKDYPIPNSKIVLKKGTTVFIPAVALQRDPEYYPDPDRFDPDRFTDESKATRPDCTWLPFGEGPRICIGLRFGMMQIKVGLCQLLLNYKFTLSPRTILPITLDPNIFMASPLHKIYLNAEEL